MGKLSDQDKLQTLVLHESRNIFFDGKKVMTCFKAQSRKFWMTTKE